MRVAVLSLTRDRLDYTRHCFSSLHRNAGLGFDHYVLDQGSTDGTQEWLRNEYAPRWMELLPENIGISRGFNVLLDRIKGYDVVVTFDNDCAVVTPGTLRACANAALAGNMPAGPLIKGLNSPPVIDSEGLLSGYRVGFTDAIGNILMAFPDTGFRFDEDNHRAYGAARNICHSFGAACQLLDYPAWHYETSEGQKKTYPDYQARKEQELAA